MSDVQAFVRDAHGDIDAVRSALVEDPTLANAAWDWGDGDWESALGAAGHMGRRDIAELLLAHGARLDLFFAGVLGGLGIGPAVLAGPPRVAKRAGTPRHPFPP